MDMNHIARISDAYSSFLLRFYVIRDSLLNVKEKTMVQLFFSSYKLYHTMELFFEVPKQRQDSTRHQTATKEKKQCSS
jgi:hypothetical protein